MYTDDLMERMDALIDRKITIRDKLEAISFRLDDEVIKYQMSPLVNEYQEVDSQIQHIVTAMEQANGSN
jgi:hypothetical protein